ncbi:MAG: DUF4375 domain-containing protein [Maritimibacter sp.]
MMAKISEQYFQRLLNHPNALEAVSVISGFWSHRADGAKSMFGLSLPEYRCELALIYSGEVGNGGHSQFFANRGHDRINDYIAALDAVSLPDLGCILAKAAETPIDLQSLHELDEQAWSYMSAVEPALQAFLEDNSNQVLQSERMP